MSSDFVSLSGNFKLDKHVSLSGNVHLTGNVQIHDSVSISLQESLNNYLKDSSFKLLDTTKCNVSLLDSFEFDDSEVFFKHSVRHSRKER